VPIGEGSNGVRLPVACGSIRKVIDGHLHLLLTGAPVWHFVNITGGARQVKACMIFVPVGLHDSRAARACVNRVPPYHGGAPKI